MGELTWEKAVEYLRQQPGQEALVRACFYDDPLVEAARRFAESEEWLAVRAFLPGPPGKALDLGAGRGIASYALANDGWQVTALEPDPSPIVGAGAIRALAQEAGLQIQVVRSYAEKLPFEGDVFDLVYGRQVLHHSGDLSLLCREVKRVLKPGGRFIATREHVITKQSDLSIFLDSHPLHRFYGGENAYLLQEYVSAIRESGLHIIKILGPFESVINYFPMTYEEWRTTCSKPLSAILGRRVARTLVNEGNPVGRYLLRWLSVLLSRLSNDPGRLYSFSMEKRLK